MPHILTNICGRHYWLTKRSTASETDAFLTRAFNLSFKSSGALKNSLESGNKGEREREGVCGGGGGGGGS